MMRRPRTGGALVVYVSGIGVSTACAATRTRRSPSHPVRTGVMLGLVALVMADIPIVVTGNGDPRTWSGADWLSDLIPHLAYGMTSAAALGRR
jgi:hypothetical protein